MQFYDLPESKFPLVMVLKDASTGEILHTERAEGPGALRVPGFHPRKVNATLEFGDGTYISATHDGKVEEGMSERKQYLLTHSEGGQELYEPRSLLITEQHAELLRKNGMTLEPKGGDWSWSK